jgi:hypothetical protein
MARAATRSSPMVKAAIRKVQATAEDTKRQRAVKAAGTRNLMLGKPKVRRSQALAIRVVDTKAVE